MGKHCGGRLLRLCPLRLQTKYLLLIWIISSKHRLLFAQCFRKFLYKIILRLIIGLAKQATKTCAPLWEN